MKSDLQEKLLRLREMYPIPDVSNIEPFRFTLDGGGRHIVTNLIDEVQAKIMIEIGVFLGGSCYDWLNHDPNLTLIAIDPWSTTYNAANALRHYDKNFDSVPQTWRYITDRMSIIQRTERNGFYKQAIANLSPFGARVVPVRALAAEAMPIIRDLQIEPDIVYIDADKTRRSIDEVYSIFPNARICGDDWGWRDSNGNCPMNEAVEAFAREHGKDFKVVGVTWVLS